MRRSAALSIDEFDHISAYDEETVAASGGHRARPQERSPAMQEPQKQHASDAKLHTLHGALLSPNAATHLAKSPARELIARLRQELLQNQQVKQQDAESSRSSTISEDIRARLNASIDNEPLEQPLTAWQRLEKDLQAVKDSKKLNTAVEGWLERLHNERQNREALLNEELLNIGQCQDAIHAATSAVDVAEQNAFDHEMRLHSLTENLQRLVNFLDSGDRVIVNPQHGSNAAPPTQQSSHSDRIAEHIEQSLREDFQNNDFFESEQQETHQEHFQQTNIHASREAVRQTITDASEAMSLMYHNAPVASPVMREPVHVVPAPTRPAPVIENPFAAFYAASASTTSAYSEKSGQEINQPGMPMPQPVQKMVAPRQKMPVQEPARPSRAPSASLPQTNPMAQQKTQIPDARAIAQPQPPRDLHRGAAADPAPRRPEDALTAKRPRMQAPSPRISPAQGLPLVDEKALSLESSFDMYPENTLSQEPLYDSFQLETGNSRVHNQGSDARDTGRKTRVSSAQKSQIMDRTKAPLPHVAAEGNNKKTYILSGIAFFILTIAGAAFLAYGMPNLSDRGDSIEKTAVVTPTQSPTQLASLDEKITQSPSTLAAIDTDDDDNAAVIMTPRTTGSIAIKKPNVRLAEIGSLGELPMVSSNPTLQEEALAGDAFAVYELAHRLEAGQGVVRDVAMSSRLFLRAAEQGFVPAQRRIAHQYEKGIGVARDPLLAREWYRRAAEAGNVKAMHQLGMTFAQGIGGPLDNASAVLWFKRAAKFGHKDSQFNFAIMASRGFGMKASYVQAYIHFAAAAKQGDKDAAGKRDEVGTRLGPEDLAFARKAAEQWANQAHDSAANDVPEITM